MTETSPVQLGLGLIGIGRPWGHVDPVVPSEPQAYALLDRAWQEGIRYLDTAPSYALSEERLGRWLRRLGPAERKALTVATKFGENWNRDTAQPHTDHSFPGLRDSLERSGELLGQVEVLQLHKTNPAALRSDDFARACEYAKSLGISIVGASVSDLESAAIAVAQPDCGVIQCPYNTGSQQFANTISAAIARGMLVATNRPFGMGQLLYGEQAMTNTQAYAFVLQRVSRGVVLTGTKSPEHLSDNVRAFRAALAA